MINIPTDEIEDTSLQIKDVFSDIKKQYDKIIESKQADQYALIYMNIKKFDTFNVVGTWAFANKVLHKVYNAVNQHLQSDEIIVHLFADHFAFLIRYENRDHLRGRLLEIIQSIYEFKGTLLYHNIYASFGIYELAFEEVDFYEALIRANLTRKENKTSKNRSFFWDFYDDEIMTKFTDTIHLEYNTTMAYKDEAFIPYLQPKVDPRTNKIIGAEALLRWFDEDGVSIPVHSFLPILNQNEYIVLVDLNIFNRVCKLLDNRIRQGLSVVPISFNISKACFYTPSFLNKYLEIFNKYEIPRSLIEFELMESITLDDTEKLNATIQDIKQAGFTCVLDDFGTGYSSFTLLLNASIDEIKIDRQFFVHELNDESRKLIKTVIDLIHSLGMKITAEGIETKEYVDLLIDCDVEYIQGFYYHQPLPLDEFVKQLNKSN